MRPSMMLRLLVAMLVVGTVASSTAPAAPTEASGNRYVDRMYTIGSTTTNVEYGVAPSLTTGNPESLLLDIYSPDDGIGLQRPVIVFIHGGAFRFGNKSLMTAAAQAYAERGFVTVSINYRLDPGSQCLEVQSGGVTGQAARARCQRAMDAAQQDATTAIAWLQSRAPIYGIDFTRIAAWGSSAGAVTAAHLAYRSDDFRTTHNIPAIRAGVAMSGCNYDPPSIGAGDASMLFVHAEGDPLVPFACARSNVDAARAAGLAAETLFWYGEAAHADALYSRYRSEIDAAATAFLIDQMDLTRVRSLTLTPFHGEPNRDAIVSIVSVDNAVPGYLQVLPCATAGPVHPGAWSNLNTDERGQVRAGIAVAHFDSSGAACVFNSAPGHVVVDLLAYLSVGAVANTSNVRVFDTRRDVGRPVAAGSFTIISGAPETTAVYSIVATETTAPGYLQVLPCDQAPGAWSNLNISSAGQTVANTVVVPFGSTGLVCLYSQSATHIAIDLQAQLADGVFVPTPAGRVLDTRSTGAGSAPNMVQVHTEATGTALLTLTATDVATPGFVQALACGGSVGGSSNLNTDRVGQTIATATVVDLDASGAFCLFSSGTTHLVADIQGRFAPWAIDDVPDVRLLDTRP